MNTIFAIFWVVVLRVGEPRDWPQLLGNPQEAYTLGRFWSRFWHRGHVSAYVDFTQLLINLLPRKLRNNKRFTTTIRHFLFFLFSGIVHSLVSWQMGDHCAYETDIWFYLTNFAAVSIEGVVLSHFGKSDRREPSTEQGTEKETEKEKQKEKGNTDSGKRGRRPNSKQVALMWRCIGYIWVLAFFFWSVPKFSYPKLQCAMEEQYLRMMKGLFRWEGTLN
ncbi:hypothetical protein LTR70_004214 [Exophiala xenobiotica]|uniref:Wax synthase domain-containing protein n=1 Tax=Lithohypha guttulata TaxID=1690604 RepID=A0ABR0KG87_9EURO|nr:hypothetical protein LTR24_003696 [Lithohypha guttulata]KAK5321501.1 hypothetical protein LTR70_004214 [Exophiala xenobiotica]